MSSEDSAEGDGSPSRSWLERIGQALLGEPNSRQELLHLLRDAQQRQLLDSDVLTIMEGALKMSEQRVRDVMLPRSQMAAIDRDWPLERVIDLLIESGHSRFPVFGDSRDDVVGILIVKDLLRVLSGPSEARDAFCLADVLRPVKIVPESKRLDSLLREFRLHRLHMAVVVDEYGGVSGLITIEDVLEQIVGEIDDEHDDEDEVFIREDEKGDFIIQALTPIEDFNQCFRTDFDDERADTIGGLLMMALGRMPKRGEIIHLGEFRFQVLRADRQRIHQLSMQKPALPEVSTS